MKVAFVNQAWIPSLPPGGSLEIWTYQVARRLAPELDVRVCGGARLGWGTRSDQGVAYRTHPTLPDGVAQRLLARLPLYRNPRRPRIVSRAYYLGYALQIAASLRRWRADVIHVHNQFAFAPTLRRLNPRARIVLHMHSEWLSQLDVGWVERAVSASDVVVGCSEHVTSRARARFPELGAKFRVLHNGVDLDLFQPPERRPDPSPDGARLLFVGRVSPEKGIHVLLDALERVLDGAPETTLDILGGFTSAPVESIVRVSEDAAVRELARFYGDQGYVEQLRARMSERVAQRVRFLGLVSHEETARAYHRSEILVNPSLSESFGMSLIEAGATAMPVLAARAGGMPEVVADGVSGLLVEPDDAAALAAALLELIRDPERRASMGEAGRARARDRFSWERIAEETRRLHASLADVAT